MIFIIKEYKGFLVDDNFNIYNKQTNRKLSPFVGTDGYYQVSRKKDTKAYHIRVHTLFAHCFIPNPDPINLKYINHIDSNKLNNSLDNLEWCTNSYNVKHGWDSGNRTHKNNTKVMVVDVKDPNIKYEFSSIRQLSENLKLDRHKVARILKGEQPNNYDYLFFYI